VPVLVKKGRGLKKTPQHFWPGSTSGVENKNSPWKAQREINFSHLGTKKTHGKCHSYDT
jgi:hypothetical protein